MTLSSHLWCPQWMCQVQLRPGRAHWHRTGLPWRIAQIVPEINWEIWIHTGTQQMLTPPSCWAQILMYSWANIPLWCNVTCECPCWDVSECDATSKHFFFHLLNSRLWKHFSGPEAPPLCLICLQFRVCRQEGPGEQGLIALWPERRNVNIGKIG